MNRQKQIDLINAAQLLMENGIGLYVAKDKITPELMENLPLLDRVAILPQDLGNKKLLDLHIDAITDIHEYQDDENLSDLKRYDAIDSRLRRLTKDIESA